VAKVVYHSAYRGEMSQTAIRHDTTSLVIAFLNNVL